jgi:adenine deaminase
MANSEEKIVEKLRARLAVARGDQPASLLLKNGQLVNVITGETEKTNIAVEDGVIAAIGEQYTSGIEKIDLNGGFIVPGLIDAHLHIESTLLTPPELARVLVPHGTTCVINDPHEIANVLGTEGVALMLDSAEGLPCDFLFTVPSCVPATEMETAGAELNAGQVTGLLKHPLTIGLGEMMNYPGLIEGDGEVLAKLAAALQAGKVIDGHAPAVSGTALQAYLSTGISTDHETVTADEALEKLRSGMKIIIRHGSASSSLEELLPLIQESNVDAFLFGSDDREAGELLARGHLDDLLRTAAGYGADPVLLIKIATVNAARHYRLFDRGLLAPGYRADLVVFNNLKDFRADLVVKDGRITARKGELAVTIPPYNPPPGALKTIRLAKQIDESNFSLRASSGKTLAIGVVPGQLVTEKLLIETRADRSGEIRADPEVRHK